MGNVIAIIAVCLLSKLTLIRNDDVVDDDNG